MFPFTSILSGISNELRVPGQDSPATFSAFNTYPTAATAGVWFRASGILYRRQNSNIFAQPNMWIHSDLHGIVDASLYEARYTSVTGDTGEMTGNALDTWFDCDTEPQWNAVALAGEFGADTATVSGIIQVREKANHANIRSGNLTLDAEFEGLS